MNLGVALNNAGKLARWLRQHHRAQSSIWEHALMANGSIVSWRAWS